MQRWNAVGGCRLLNEVRRKSCPSFSAQDLRWSIENNRCFVNGQVERFASTQVKTGDRIAFSPEKTPVFSVEKGRVLYEDSHILVYDKPPWLTSEALAALLCCQLVHRLDKETSGVMVLARQKSAQRNLEGQFLKRTVKKEYLAKVVGVPGANEGVVCGNMAAIYRREGAVLWGLRAKGVWSKTHWKLHLRQQGAAWLLCLPVTGRTHQIRVHLQSIGHPLIGDYTYGKKGEQESFRQLLHARRIAFAHPATDSPLCIEAPFPRDFPLEIF